MFLKYSQETLILKIINQGMGGKQKKENKFHNQVKQGDRIKQIKQTFLRQGFSDLLTSNVH